MISNINTTRKAVIIPAAIPNARLSNGNTIYSATKNTITRSDARMRILLNFKFVID